MSVITRKFQFCITPEEMAHAFSGFNDDAMARFFNSLDQEIQSWARPETALLMQLAFVSDNRTLNNGGRRIMRLIGEYANKYPENPL